MEDPVVPLVALAAPGAGAIDGRVAGRPGGAGDGSQEIPRNAIGTMV